MVEVNEIIKIARYCHSKQGWEEFFRRYYAEISSSTDPKLTAGIYRLLSQDPQWLNYNGKILETLIKSCWSTYNFELGKTLCYNARKISSPNFSLPAAQLLIESGECALARSLLVRSLRLSSLTPQRKAALIATQAASYIAEHKLSKALTMIERCEKILKAVDPHSSDWAILHTQLGRILHQLGYYRQAAAHLDEAAEQFGRLKLWLLQAEALFYAGVSLECNGPDFFALSQARLELSRSLAATHALTSLNYKFDEYEGDLLFRHGHYNKAQSKYRTSVEQQQKSAQNYPRLIVVIKIIFCQFANGRTQTAIKQGKIIFGQIAQIKNAQLEPYRLRLEARLAWEQSQFTSSQNILYRYLSALPPQGIERHENTELLACYLLESASLGADKIPPQLPQPRFLAKGHYLNLVLSAAKAQLAINQGSFTEARHYLNSVRVHRPAQDYLPVKASALDALIQLKLIQHQTDSELRQFILQFKQILTEFDSTTLRPLLDLAYAASAYQLGDFPLCVKHIVAAQKNASAPLIYQCAFTSWRSNIEGKPSRVINEVQVAPFSRLTRHYFAPILEIAENSTYLVSRHYLVSLAKNPSLQALMEHLLQQPHFEGTLADFQKSVWLQSLRTAGWQHKIRNSLMRLGKLFPYTIAPLTLRSRSVRLFTEAILINFPRKNPEQRQDEITSLLRKSPMSSRQLRQHLATSRATIKRLLALLIDRGIINKTKKGRSYEYSLVK